MSNTPAYDPALAAKAQDNYEANKTNPNAVGQTETGNVVYNTPSYDPSGDIAALNKEIAAENANYTALQSQIAAQPVLPAYDTTAAYATAQKQATTSEDAVYQDKLNNYLQGEALGKSQQTQAEGEAETAANTTLTNQTADNATTQARAAEDEATQTGQANQSQANTQEDTGTAFNNARNALLGNVANSGLTTSGIGQNEVGAATTARNQSELESTEGFDNSRAAIATTANRTFEDLATSNTRNTSANATSIAQSKEGLQNYIDNANLAEQGERLTEGAQEQSDIASTSENLYQQGVQQFIASLVGSGARPQDIALAAQVYGGS